MTASRHLCFIVAAVATAVPAGTTEHFENCPSDLNHASSPSCKSTATDVPPVANIQLQSAALRQRGIPGAPMELPSASLAAISRRSGSKQMRMYSAAEEVKQGVERVKATWDSSMDEINGLISGIADHDSASQDTCSTQLTEYKKKLTKIHESTVSISTAVQSTTSEVSIYDKECKEKDEELKEIEKVHTKRVKKCTTERKVEKKTLETLRYDMKSMKKIAKAHIHVKNSKYGGSPYMLLEQEAASHPRHSLADVRGMVKKTKEVASKLQTCLAKSHLDKQKGEVSLSEEDSHPPPRCDGIAPRCYPITCTHGGWVCGEVNKCPLAKPRCHPVSCVNGQWKCGAVTDSAYEACHGKGRGDTCQFTPPGAYDKKVGKCVVQGLQKYNLMQLDGDAEEADGGEDAHGIEDDSNLEEDDHDDEDDDDNEDDGDDDDDEKDIEDEDSNDENSEETEGGVEVFLQEGSEDAHSVSPFVKPPHPPVNPPVNPPYPDPFGTALKCVPAGSPAECQEVVVELEHQFTESYVSLTRMIEEYEVVTHSTVCEETVEEEYTQESTAISTEANQICGQVQTTMGKLEHYKFEYESTIKTEQKLETSIKSLTKQCGSLSSTEEYLTTVTSTLTALGDCPGLGEVEFKLPTWTGAWAKFKQRRNKSNKWNDERMLRKCVKKFGQSARPAEVSEIDGRSIEGMPKKNTAPFTVLGACPDCKGKPMPGVTKNGYGRICWDSGYSFSRKGRRRDCGGGPRSILCVYNGDTNYPGPSPPPPPSPPPTPPGTFTTPQALMDCPAGPPIATTQCMSTSDYTAIENNIRQIMNLLGDHCDAQDCPQADWAGCVLRMAGHDFMDFDPTSGRGGSDACTNMEDPDNKGLEPCLSQGEFGHSLRDVYQHHCTRISLADFIVVAAEAVMTVLRDRVRITKPAAPLLKFKETFLFGRTTADENCHFVTQLLPNPEGSCSEVRRVFMDNLGLDERGAAALMGVHSIGRARVENSGYRGFWSDPENSRLFNNNYYVSMLVKGWLPVEVSPDSGKHQWNRADQGIRDMGASAHEEMMLNTDLCLAYDNFEELNAERHDDCCAWVDSFVVGGNSNGQHDKAVINNNGLFCGVNCATDPELNAVSPGNGCNGGLDERRKCCGPRADKDCGRPDRPAGMAIDAVKEFAFDDSVWLEAFEEAWGDVTELGAHDLEHLRAFCPEALNQQQNHT